MNIAGTLISLVTGSSPGELQAEAAAAEQQITLAIQTMIALTALNAALLGVLVVLAWKGKS
jgi:heme/copper-type cytochrome/quinol oxidase subunit 2